MESIREDYPDAAYYSLMNLLDSHDTERLRWTLTPGEETTAAKELNAANVAEGILRQQLASVIQFTVPGAPTVFYGDEVGVTGDAEPDNRRTFPWADKGGSPDQTMFGHYQALNALRSRNKVLVNGNFKILLADDASGVVAYGRKTNNLAAVIIVNRSHSTQSGAIPVAGYLPDGVTLHETYTVGSGSASSVTVSNGAISGLLGAMSAVVFISGNVDLEPTAAPENLRVTGEGNGSVTLSWDAVSGSTGYNVYHSRLSGGGYERVTTGPISGTSFNDTNLLNAANYYYVVTLLDGVGNESNFSNEVQALPHLVIGWANLQWPPSMNHAINVTNRTSNAYGRVWIDGVTNQAGATEGLRAQLGYGPSNSNPDGNNDWIWMDASFNVDAGNNDEFVVSLLPESTGAFDYAFRYTTTNGRDWVYADLDGIGNCYNPAQAGKLTVNSSGDTTAPTPPTGLNVLSASPIGVELAWDANAGDPSLYRYEVLRSDTPGGPYTMIARVTAASYADLAVDEGATYFYVVRALDQSFNSSGNSAQVSAKAELRTVTLNFNVTVPASTDATGRSVYVAGFLDRLDGGLPQWNPGGVALTHVDATHWVVTLTGKEYTQIEYKFTLGSWGYVEKGGACGEIASRQLTLIYGATLRR
jgi:hypothetical protein